MTKNEYGAVIFDVDGTLLNTAEGVLSAVKYTIRQYGLRELSENELQTFIGPPIQNSFQKHYGITDYDQLQTIATTFRNRYKDVDLLKAEPYEGIYELCEALTANGIRIAIATYKREDYAIKLLKHFRFDRYTEIMYGADHENKLKKSDIICKCLDALQITEKHQAVMIGDSENDAKGAEQIGLDFIGVTYGFDFRTSDDIMKYSTAIGSADFALDILKLLN